MRTVTKVHEIVIFRLIDFQYLFVIYGSVSPIAKGLFVLLSFGFWSCFMMVFVLLVPQSQSYYDFADRCSLRQLIPSFRVDACGIT
jgi:hypothetical protein